jgi:glycyl-tRNA synthetase beta chain
MPEFFLELFSEEIPARLQREVTEVIRQAIETSLAALQPRHFQAFYGPRRQAIFGQVAATTDQNFVEVRGPKEGAPAPAVAGFARKQGIAEDALILEGGSWWRRETLSPQPAAAVLQSALPALMQTGFWPKTMRWGQGGAFAWIRPLRRAIVLLDGAPVPMRLGPVEAGAETEGHRVLAPGAVSVTGAAQYVSALRARFVIADPAARRDLIAEGLAALAAARNLTIAEDPGLLDEVTGLVEWPVPLLGRIDDRFMDLPPEVRELSMKVNQKYFALRNARGEPAPYFAFVANLAAADGGAAIIAGNERVLRARLSDARHFWDIDRRTPLDTLLPKLEKITFHAKIGTQRARADRISALAARIARHLGDDKDAAHARTAGLLAKADLVTGMVGEFPELQGIMGGYYASAQHGEEVGQAIRTHYQPKGPSDPVPAGIVAVSVALADKLDTLTNFFAAGEKPSGSGDPYALRRAALGVIRIILENRLRLPLKPLLDHDAALFDFIIDRLRVKLRGEGRRFDVLDAVLAAGADDDLLVLMLRVEALDKMLATEDGANLQAAYKRAANILNIEDAKDGPHDGAPAPLQLNHPAEFELSTALGNVQAVVLDGQDGQTSLLAQERYQEAMKTLASLRPTIDAFFTQLTVNDPAPETRATRLALLRKFCHIVNKIADFSKLEG